MTLATLATTPTTPLAIPATFTLPHVQGSPTLCVPHLSSLLRTAVPPTDGVFQSTRGCQSCAATFAEQRAAEADIDRRATQAGILAWGIDRPHDDSSTLWFVFPRPTTLGHMRDTLDRLFGIEWDGWRCCNGLYDCCGHIGQRPAWVETLPHYAVVRIAQYRDI